MRMVDLWEKRISISSTMLFTTMFANVRSAAIFFFAKKKVAIVLLKSVLLLFILCFMEQFSARCLI